MHGELFFLANFNCLNTSEILKMFIPTKSEKSVLEIFKNESKQSLLKDEILQKIHDEKIILKALEGCLAKGYLEYSDSHYTLTESGKSVL